MSNEEAGAPMPVRGIPPRLVGALAYFGYAAVLYWSFIRVESIVYASTGLRLTTFTPTLLLGQLALLGLPFLFAPVAIRRPSEAAAALLWTLVYIPFLIAGPHLTPAGPVTGILRVAGLGIALALALALPRAPAAELPVPSVPRSWVYGGIAAATLAAALFVAALNGFRIDLSIADVYTRRLAARETIGVGSLGSYVFAMLVATLVPIGLAAGIGGRRWIALLAAAVGVVAAFSFTGQKSIILTPLFLLGIALFVRYARSWAGALIPAGSAVLVMIAAQLWLQRENVVMSALFTQRMLMAAARNTGLYFDYFSVNPHYYLAGSRFASYDGTLYHQPMGMMMGEQAVGLEGLNLNSNVWAYAFGEAGWAGVFVVSLLVGVVFWVVDGFHARWRTSVPILVGAFLAFIFTSSAFQTSLLTGGVLPSLACLALLAAARERSDADGVVKG